MSVLLGVDCGGTGTKIVAWEKETQHTLKRETFPSLCNEPLNNWIEKLPQWAKEIQFPLSRVEAIGIAIAAPLVDGKVYVPDQTGKFWPLKGNAVEAIASQLSEAWGGHRVAILHDGSSALLGQLAIKPELQRLRSVGILTFGYSVGFGYAWFGEPLIGPYTSWVSHIQLRPGFPGSFCAACHQSGCWRAVYQAFRDSADHQALVEVIAQGIATVLNILPLNCLFLGGGRISRGGSEFFDRICCELKPRLVIDPKQIVQPARADEYAGAIGAAFYAYRNPNS